MAQPAGQRVILNIPTVYNCPFRFCHKKVMSVDELRNHTSAVHVVVYLCQICKIEFATLAEAYRCHRSPEQKPVCSVCIKPYSAATYDAHVKKCRTRCLFCNCSFMSYHSVSVHERTCVSEMAVRQRELAAGSRNRNDGASTSQPERSSARLANRPEQSSSGSMRPNAPQAIAQATNQINLMTQGAGGRVLRGSSRRSDPSSSRQ